jgi:nucleoside-diphosphate-sugar epimerase/predicted dehydrogenase
MDSIDEVEAAIVAVPNYLHSKVSVDFLNSGCDVLCEKPIAMNTDEAAAMITASHNTGHRLAVNLIRRRFDSYRIARTILSQDLLGNIESVKFEEGMISEWPFRSSYALQRERSGGGVLVDWGTHVLDMLYWLFGGQWTLVNYKDNGLGRIESSCELDFRIKCNMGNFPCHVELSQSRKLDNKLSITAPKACLDVHSNDLTGIYLRVADYETRIGKTERRTYTSYFPDQIRSFLSGLHDDCLAGEDAIQGLRFIESCYSNRQDLKYPWERYSGQNMNWTFPSRHKRILVVGASGFLGTRLTEKLSLDLNVAVRATVHRPEKSLRLARLPVELVDCDLLKKNQVMKAVEGCDVVINCSKGRMDTSGDPRTVMDVYVEGTKNLLEAAEKNEVKKFVHISTAAIHGFRHKSSLVDESCPLKHTLSRSPYEKGKIESEKLVMEYAKKSPCVILRPTLIYGPYSEDWGVRVIQRIKNKQASLVGSGGLANFVFVDDVVEAILLSIERDEGNGTVFLINNEERVLWEEYVDKLAAILGTPPTVLPECSLEILKLSKNLSLLKDSIVAFGGVIKSPQMLLLLSRIPLLLVVGPKLVKGKKRANIEMRLSSAREIEKPNVAMISKYETPSKALCELLSCQTTFSASKAKTMLGFIPRTSFQDGFERTLDWIKWAHLMDN